MGNQIITVIMTPAQALDGLSPGSCTYYSQTKIEGTYSTYCGVGRRDGLHYRLSYPRTGTQRTRHAHPDEWSMQQPLIAGEASHSLVRHKAKGGASLSADITSD
jgi:hypothetical protein